ncbi:metallopeptidase family protein [Peptoniphilus sp.]|jgi:predicted Zn-dependent protease with MMP-like domain|uniref:metallopeptidase family protein n=1 Tax=Peptoniphilus sp. TaxID=1971214 RepID=UPI003D9495E3
MPFDGDYIDYDMSRIDEVEELLDEICEEIPKYAFDHLNGGIILSEDVKYHEASVNKHLIIMGEYQRSILGNMITIYYGSFMKMYGYLSRDELKDKLRDVLLHELRHHMEFLANEDDLVVEDNKFIADYKKRMKDE